jgi:hypothetical protein
VKSPKDAKVPDVDRRGARTRCSFCGKPRDQARRMVAGPGVFICGDCVQLCNEILALDASAPPTPPPNPRSSADRRILGKMRLRRLALTERWKGLMRRLGYRRFELSG